MYEVFFNDRRLILATANEGKILNSGDCWPYSGNKDLLSLFMESLCPGISGAEYYSVGSGNPDSESLNKGTETDIVITGDAVQLWEDFCGLFDHVPAAGGVVESIKGYLFIYRKGIWDLPKGKIDPGETPELAALREVREETGLRDVIINGHFRDTWHVYPSPCRTNPLRYVLKKTSWYSMTAPGEQVLVPEYGEEITQAVWFSPEQLDVPLSNTYRSLKTVIGLLA